MHIVRWACGEVFDIVFGGVSERGQAWVEQEPERALNPHVEKREIPLGRTLDADYASI
jgi:hypothetical protein